ncbi:hypothetical protein FHS60_001028 [Alloprevotella rava]|uniref:Uncharacterized protein n=1 Tax=Alloprevotella rava TaxID=671218 RepID=A0A7W5Y1F5_9BACT|nr:hypothetical protein [Alloprevotella rava]
MSAHTIRLSVDTIRKYASILIVFLNTFILLASSIMFSAHTPTAEIISRHSRS